jgi:DNA-binding NarL/FixJ family response regulator
MKIRILIADNDGAARKRIRDLLAGDPEIQVVRAEAVDGTTTVELTHQHQPDVVLMDILMPGKTDCVSAISWIRQQMPGTEVVALTSVLDGSAMVRALRAGAIGYIGKPVIADQLRQTIYAAAAGRVQLPFGVPGRLIYDQREPESELPISFWSQSPFEHAVSRIMREHDLFNHRLTWLVTSQTLFLTAYALLTNQYAYLSTLKTSPSPEIQGFISAIPWVGLTLCALMYLSIIGALFAIRYWRDRFREEQPTNSIFSLVGSEWGHVLGLIAPIFTPLVFVCIWVAFLTHLNLVAVLGVLLIGALVFFVYLFTDILRWLGFKRYGKPNQGSSPAAPV